MGLFDGIFATAKDRTRRQLIKDLHATGLNVRLAAPGTPERGISGGLMGNSLCVIKVENSPIQWINVLEHPASRFAATTFTNVYIVPDNRVRSGGYLELRSARRRSASVYGRVIDVTWTAEFVGTRAVTAPEDEWDDEMEDQLLEQLNNKQALKNNLIKLNEDIIIRSVPNFWCWAIMSGSYQEESAGRDSKKNLAPSQEQWECYELIADLLLELTLVGEKEEDIKTSEPEHVEETGPITETPPPEPDSP